MLFSPILDLFQWWLQVELGKTKQRSGGNDHSLRELLVCWYDPDLGILVQREIIKLYCYDIPLYGTSFTSRTTDKPYSTDLDMFGKIAVFFPTSK